MIDKHSEWINYYCDILESNALIDLRSMESRRNFDPIYFGKTNISLIPKDGYIKDTYYENYDRFCPVAKYKIKTYPEYAHPL